MRKRKDISEYDYGYYDSSVVDRLEEKLFHKRSLNCNDFDYADEQINKMKGKYIRENIIRKATTQELEWLNRQLRVTDPEKLKELKPIMEWLDKYVWGVE